MRSAETELQNTIELRARASKIAAPKPDLDAKAKKKTILKHFVKGFFKGKLLAPKWRKSADKSLSQPSCSHSNTIYDLQLQKTIVLRMQPRHQATLTQPLQCDLHPQLQDTHRTTHTGTTIPAKHRGGTNRVRNDRSRNRRTDEVPFIVACSHFTPKNTRFGAPASSPQHSPCNIHTAIPMRSAPAASRHA